MQTELKEKLGKLFNVILGAICVVGIWLRLHVYLINRSLWMDEAALANNLLLPNTILDNMQYQQAAPPIFKLLSLINVNIFGLNEYALRLFPLICGILSIFVFLLVLKNITNSKIFQISAISLFAVNYYLIYYASEFKQYSSDALCALILCFLALKINLKTASQKNILTLSVVNASIFWLSHASLFVLAGIFLYQLISFKNEIKENIKKLLTLYTPAGVSFTVFWFLHLKTVASSDFMHKYWTEHQAFLTSTQIAKASILGFLEEVLYPNTITIFALICLALGAYKLWKHNQKAFGIIVLPILLVLLLSALKIYPFSLRLILWTIPFLIILLSACLINLTARKPFMATILTIILIATISKYFTLYPTIILKKNIWLREEIRPLYEYLETRLKPNDTIVLANDMYQQDKFYQRKFNFKNKKIIKRLDAPPIYEQIIPGKRYMFVFDAYWNKLGQLNTLVEWLKTNTRVLSQYEYYQNYVFYVERR